MWIHGVKHRDSLSTLLCLHLRQRSQASAGKNDKSSPLTKRREGQPVFVPLISTEGYKEIDWRAQWRLVWLLMVKWSKRLEVRDEDLR